MMNPNYGREIVVWDGSDGVKKLNSFLHVEIFSVLLEGIRNELIV